MTLPEDLVKAVAEALVNADGFPGAGSPAAYQRDARIAVAVVLRALPECPDPIDPTCCQNGEWRGHACQYHQGYEDGWDAAIARLAGERTTP